jgi:hypothetical protein
MLLVVSAFLLIGAGEPANPLFKELMDKGIPLPAGPAVRLAPPLMNPGLTGQELQAVLAKAAGSHPLDLFLKRTDAAPFTLTLHSVDDAAGKRVAQTIDLAFVAYGNLDRVVKEDVLNQLLGTNAKKGKDLGEVKLLSPDKLKERGIKLLQAPNLEERYAGLDVFLLEKVKITGVTRNVKAHGPGWVLLAMQLDSRFEKDKQYPNRWRSYNALEDTLGSPQAYSGLGGYALVTRLAQPEGALFFELHAALHEPEAWFGGPNLLRSKLPLVIQENVRTLRRKLKEKE